MSKSGEKTIQHFALQSLQGCVPEEHINSICQLIETIRREFQRTFGKADPHGDTVNGVVGIKMDVWSDDVPEEQVVSIVHRERTPIDSGPDRRKPIRCGGGKCITIKLGSFTYTICIDWEGPCSVLVE